MSDRVDRVSVTRWITAFAHEIFLIVTNPGTPYSVIVYRYAKAAERRALKASLDALETIPQLLRAVGEEAASKVEEQLRGRADRRN